jgi:hypothetical protein
VKWAELKRALVKKLSAEEEQGAKHGRMIVQCDGMEIGRALLSRGSDEMSGREIGNVARSLRIKEHQLKELVSCTLSGEDYCALVTGAKPPAPS